CLTEGQRDKSLRTTMHITHTHTHTHTHTPRERRKEKQSVVERTYNRTVFKEQPQHRIGSSFTPPSHHSHSFSLSLSLSLPSLFSLSLPLSSLLSLSSLSFSLS